MFKRLVCGYSCLVLLCDKVLQLCSGLSCDAGPGLTHHSKAVTGNKVLHDWCKCYTGKEGDAAEHVMDRLIEVATKACSPDHKDSLHRDTACFKGSGKELLQRIPVLVPATGATADNATHACCAFDHWRLWFMNKTTVCPPHQLESLQMLMHPLLFDFPHEICPDGLAPETCAADARTTAAPAASGEEITFLHALVQLLTVTKDTDS